MKTVAISVSDNDYKKYFPRRSKLSFSDLREKILSVAFQQSLENSIRLAKKSSLSKMTMKEINAEVAKTRKRA